MEILKEKIIKEGNLKPKRLVVISAADEALLQAVFEAKNLEIAIPILIGDREKILEIIKKYDYNIENVEIINATSMEESAEIGVKLITSGKADFIMKGLIDSSLFLKAILNKNWGLRTDSLLSHFMIYSIPKFDRLIALTDGGMNVHPNLEDKVKIINNAAKAMRAINRGEKIKIACLCAKEKVNDKMQSTIDAAALKTMYLEGEFADDIIVEGPIALDLAVSKESAKTKGYNSEIAGEANVLLVHDIEVGNGVAKSITYFARAQAAGLVMGAKVPIVMTSRSDDYDTKLNSIILGSIVSV